MKKPYITLEEALAAREDGTEEENSLKNCYRTTEKDKNKKKRQYLNLNIVVLRYLGH